MNKFDEVIHNLQVDLQPLDIPREQYLAICVENRLSENLEKYNKDFDRLLKTLEYATLYEVDLTKLLKTIKSFSQLINHLYDNLIKSIEQQENLFKD